MLRRINARTTKDDKSRTSSRMTRRCARWAADCILARSSGSGNRRRSSASRRALFSASMTALRRWLVIHRSSGMPKNEKAYACSDRMPAQCHCLPNNARGMVLLAAQRHDSQGDGTA